MRVGLYSTLLLLALATASAAGTFGAKARFCGKSKCVPIPVPLANTLSQRNESFVGAPVPKPAPFYRITIKAKGEGFINRTIIWVPSRRVWYLKEYVTPPLAGYWRSANAKTDAGLRRLARRIKPFPAPDHWVLPK